MMDFNRYKLDFVRSLPESVLDMLANITRCRSKGDDRCQVLANTSQIVSMALMHGEFTRAELVRLAEVVGADTKIASDRALAESIYFTMMNIRIQSDLGEMYPAFSEFMQSIGKTLRPFCALTSSSTTEDNQPIVGYFNPDARFETEWLVVDLSVHPNPSIQSMGAMLLRLDDFETGSVEWIDSISARESNGWFPMFAQYFIEYPSIDMANELERDIGIDFPREEFVRWYEILATWSNLMTRPGMLCRSPPDRPPEVFAQLGAWPYPWIEEPEGKPFDATIVLRTHANAEPWVEVSVDGDGKFYIAPHIT